MKRKRFSEEQIAFALRQAEGGATIEEICRKMGISEPTFGRWKKVYAGMGVTEIRRLKQLEDENAKLKRVVADLTLDKAMLQDVLRKKWRGPPFVARSHVICTVYDIGERRACKATGFPRSSQCDKPRGDPQTELRMRLRDLAAGRVRYGYRRLHVLLLREGWRGNAVSRRPFAAIMALNLSAGCSTNGLITRAS